MVAINKGWKPCFEEQIENEKKLVHSSEEAPQLELKPLRGGPKYEYLGPGKLKPRWDGLVVVKDPRDGRILKVNGQRLKPFLGGVIPEEETVSMEIPTYWDAT